MSDSGFAPKKQKQTKTKQNNFLNSFPAVLDDLSDIMKNLLEILQMEVFCKIMFSKTDFKWIQNYVTAPEFWFVSINY